MQGSGAGPNCASATRSTGLADGVSIRTTPDLWARGGVFAIRVTYEESPIGRGGSARERGPPRR